MTDLPELEDAAPEPDDSLRLDNELLRRRLEALGAMGYEFDSDDPKLENQFLNYVLSFEEMHQGPQIPLRSIFPDDFEFPPASSMTDEQLAAKLDAITDILASRSIVIDTVGDLPDNLLYKYVLEEIDDLEIPLEMPEGTVHHLDGCDGSCPDCFQRDYCEVKDQTWGDEQDEPEQS